MIHVVAVITAKPGQREAVLKDFHANVPNVLAERGCIEYGAAVDAQPALPFQSVWGPDSFVVIEKWQDIDALKAHAEAPHMRGYAAQTRKMIANRDVYILWPTA
jgi:quinol monooxygenase YgiN